MALLKSNNFYDAVMDEIEFLRKRRLQPKFEPIARFFLDVFLGLVQKHQNYNNPPHNFFLGEKLKIYIHSKSPSPRGRVDMNFALKCTKYIPFFIIFVPTYPKHVSWDCHKKNLRNVRFLWKILKTSKSISTHPGLQYTGISNGQDEMLNMWWHKKVKTDNFITQQNDET